MSKPVMVGGKNKNRYCKHRRGSVFLIVLVMSAAISLLVLLALEQIRIRTPLENIVMEQIGVNGWLLIAEEQLPYFLDQNLNDTHVLSPPVVEENIDLPGYDVELEISSINQKLNLNLLARHGRTQQVERGIERVLTNMGYPRRVVEELINWMVSAPAQGMDRYAGLGYRAPGRKINHIDEVRLVSGFIQTGLRGGFETVFTVYGDGGLNIRTVADNYWPFLRNILSESHPDLAPHVPHSAANLDDFLNRPEVRNIIETQLPFLTMKDKTFQVIYTIKSDNLTRRFKGIYEYEKENQDSSLITLYPYTG